MGGLAGGAEDEEESHGGEPGYGAGGKRADVSEDFREAEAAEVLDEQEHREKEAKVTDTVDDESLLAGVGGGVFAEVKADEEVGREADAFPADKEQEEAFGKDEDEHEEHEEVEVGEEAPVTFVLGHVGG